MNMIHKRIKSRAAARDISYHGARIRAEYDKELEQNAGKHNCLLERMVVVEQSVKSVNKLVIRLGYQQRGGE